MRIRFLGGEDSLEVEMATHSSILAWRIPRTEEPGGLQSMRSKRVGHDWVTNAFIFSRDLLDVACGVYCSDQESNLGPLLWQHTFLVPGPPAKPSRNSLVKWFSQPSCIYSCFQVARSWKLVFLYKKIRCFFPLSMRLWAVFRKLVLLFHRW